MSREPMTQHGVERRQAALDDVVRRFTYHPPHGDQTERYQQIRAAGRTLAKLLIACCPDSRERALALTKLEEAVMWANASIARNEPPPVRASDPAGGKKGAL